jgi:hypothetical protein
MQRITGSKAPEVSDWLCRQDNTDPVPWCDEQQVLFGAVLRLVVCAAWLQANAAAADDLHRLKCELVYMHDREEKLKQEVSEAKQELQVYMQLQALLKHTASFDASMTLVRLHLLRGSCPAVWHSR